MEFLVTFEIAGLSELPEDQIRDLRQQEKDRGEEHIRAGRLLRMWRLPGQQAAIGVWNVADADELHEHLSGLPLFPYLNVSVAPLARHYLEEGPAFAER
ncbi:MAG: muconolactone Delta-isomerase [Solirubrobacterales bacterium]